MLTLQINDLNSFLNQLDKIDSNKILNTGLKKSMTFLEGESIKETPVDQGFLYNSYETFFDGLEGKLINTRSYGVAVHEGHTQQVGRFVPAIKKRLTKSFVEGNPFLTRAAEKSEKRINVIFNDEITKNLNLLKD